MRAVQRIRIGNALGPPAFAPVILLANHSRKITWMLKCCIIILSPRKGPHLEISCSHELFEFQLLSPLPPTQRNNIERPVHNLDKRKPGPGVFGIRVKEYDPTSDLVSGGLGKIML